MMTKVAQIADVFGLSEQDLFHQALISFLHEKKRQVLRQRLDILARYDVDSPEALEAKIATGSVPEHPAWEDCIVAENLTARQEELVAYLADLQNPTSSRTA